MQDIDFVDKSFSLTGNKNYRLSIQVCLNGFSFCIYDVDKQKHVVLKRFSYSRNITDANLWAKEINTIIDDVPVVKAQAKCLYITQKNVLIPKNIFSEANIRSYISFLFQLDELDEIQYRYIPEIESYCCFAIPSPVVNKIFYRFGKVDVYNQVYQAIRRAGQNPGTRMNIVFCDNFMDISVFRNNKLVLNNSFEIFDIKDIIYFISAISTKFDVKDIPLYTLGEISNKEIKILKNYFPGIVQEHNPKISLLLGPEISSKYYNLLSLYECE
ncbi:MAG: DUF3822 family protein [Prevotellaceae bacterium]|jgi:hypothetical protein|nr:DUF3822 family protein [Prevotellaceae bacterium]